MTPKEAAPAIGHFTELFERARRALVEQMGPATASVLEQPRTSEPESIEAPPSHDGVHVAAQLRVDDRTREVVVRFYDIHTGTTIREVPPRLVAAAATRLRTSA